MLFYNRGYALYCSIFEWEWLVCDSSKAEDSNFVHVIAGGLQHMPPRWIRSRAFQRRTHYRGESIVVVCRNSTGHEADVIEIEIIVIRLCNFSHATAALYGSVWTSSKGSALFLLKKAAADFIKCVGIILIPDGVKDCNNSPVA
eukprot:IDg6923t1